MGMPYLASTPLGSWVTWKRTKMESQSSSPYSISASARAVRHSGAPVDRLEALVDIALLGHLTKDLDLAGLKLGLEGEVGMLKIANHAQGA